MKYETPEAREIARHAILAVGASVDIADSLSDAIISAEWAGNGAVGFSHLVDYLDGFVTGRIPKNAQPSISTPAPGMICVDAGFGIAQLGFDRAFNGIVDVASEVGVVILTQSNCFTVGELGYYTRRLAEVGLVALAFCNAPALVATIESKRAVYGTNPLSFGAPVGDRKPLVIDQASSATAFVNIRKAADDNKSIPEGWAINSNGAPTTDAREAVDGMLLPFGGFRGANVALMIEILSAGLTGSNWSIDAPSFSQGDRSPGVGMTIIAINPDFLATNFSERLGRQIDRLSSMNVIIPGSHVNVESLNVPNDVLEKIDQVVASAKG